MSAEQDPMVVVLEPAVLGLAQHLAPRGMQVFPNDIRVKINKGVSRDWGTSKAKRFQDNSGGGWLIDLSDFFENEMLYAVVRSGPNGTRAVVKVVEADDIEAAHRGGRPLPALNEDIPETDPSSAVMAAPSTRPSTGPVTQSLAKIPEKPDDPVLVLVMNPAHNEHTGIMPVGSRTNHAGPPIENVIRTTRAEMQEVVSRLLQEGIRPEHVEIWTACRRPKVQIAFE